MENDSDDDLPLARVLEKRSSIDGDNDNDDDEDAHSSDDNDDDVSIDVTISEDINCSEEKKGEYTLFEYEWPKSRSGNYYVIENELRKFLEHSDLSGTVQQNTLGQLIVGGGG